MKMPDMIYYHGGCMDGTMAAVVLCEHTSALIPIGYGREPEWPDNGTIGFVDFCPERDVLRKLGERVTLIIDHHKTRRWVKDDARAVFDETKCGAVLAWEFLEDAFGMGLQPPILAYIQDRDLWKWELPFSREVSAGLRLGGFNPADHDLNVSIPRLIADGAAAVAANEMVVEAVCETACRYADLITVCNPVGHLTSEIGERLNSEYGILAAIWKTEKEGYLVSLRGDGAREMAEKHGGGGHDRAAGFRCSVLPWMAPAGELRP